MIKAFLEKLFKKNTDREKIFLKKLEKLLNKYDFALMAQIVFYKNNKEVSDKFEEEKIKKQINDWLKQKHLGIVPQIFIVDKKQLNPSDNGKDAK